MQSRVRDALRRAICEWTFNIDNVSPSSTAHDVLSSHGILHRDISAGNILIDVDASYEAATATTPERIVSKNLDPQNASGFLSDWEFAWFPQGVLDVAAVHSDSRAVESDSSDMKVVPGDTMTVSTDLPLAYRRQH